MSTHFALKNHFHEGRIVNDRLIFSALFAGLLFIALIARLIVLQVVEFEHFDSLSEQNRVDISSIAPQRGLIYDRNGVLLAENIPTFSLELTPENVPDIEDTLQQLAALFAMTEEDMVDIKEQIKQQRRFRQVILKERLTEKEVAIFSVNRHRFSGVDVVGRLIRHYPQGALFAHTVGYVGRINEQDLQEIDVNNYKGSMQIGKTGIEKQYEELLHGQVGYQQVETNVQGRIVRELNSMPSVSGQDLFLHLDINLQRVAAEAMADFNGAVVAIDPKTGGVLAMVSKPDFDPNEFVLGISSKNYAALRDSPDMPLFNRSLRGRYPPGSTLKPFIALAGLEYGVITEQSKSFCPGWYTLPGQDHRYRCWKSHGHGHMDLKAGIAQSCDVYFYDLANTMGIDRIHSFLDLFRFGRRTEIDLPGESKGLSPSKEWKRASRNKAWYPGETLISGIGQGFNQMTPIQIAHATAVLAMRGIDISPRVARASRPTGQSELQLFPAQTYQTLPMENSRNWEAVIDSMVEVVHGARGSARHIGKDLPFKIAGKTGTAQVFGIKQDEKYDAETLARKLHDHALFIAFAPAENPQFVVAVVVEHGGGGSTMAAPIARKIIDQYFGTAVNE
ncbi:MAG: penicillin-binding protein 2 [Pseudomonadota bacterium]|nr:penicillin-binding protein 2 [Pseudomonadota bacterium]MDO7711826.1 penicillin-binding protein 2 [Pseudomonadota bacterium]